MAKRSSQAVIAELEKKLRVLEEELSIAQQKLNIGKTASILQPLDFCCGKHACLLSTNYIHVYMHVPSEICTETYRPEWSTLVLTWPDHV